MAESQRMTTDEVVAKLLSTEQAVASAEWKSCRSDLGPRGAWPPATNVPPLMRRAALARHLRSSIRALREMMEVAAGGRERLGEEDGILVVTGMAAFEAAPALDAS